MGLSTEESSMNRMPNITQLCATYFDVVVQGVGLAAGGCSAS